MDKNRRDEARLVFPVKEKPVGMTFRIRPSLLKELREFAKERGYSLNEVVERMLRNELTRARKE